MHPDHPTRGLGHRPDPAGHMVSSARLFVGEVSPPARFSLRDWTPPIGDQYSSSSCVGWAIARAIATTLSFRDKVKHPLPSPLGIYTLARTIDRSSPRVRLIDEGSMPNQAMRAMTEWGCPSSDAWPFDLARINDDPNALQLGAASVFKFDGYYRINDSLRARQAISSGCAVPIAIDVDDAFYEHGPTGVLGSPRGTTYGGHYICLTGYETMRDSKIVWELANSWDVDWGDDGFGHGDESFLSTSTDRYAMKVRKVAS